MKLPIPIWALLLLAAAGATVDAYLTRRRLADVQAQSERCFSALDFAVDVVKAQDHERVGPMEARPGELVTP